MTGAHAGITERRMQAESRFRPGTRRAFAIGNLTGAFLFFVIVGTVGMATGTGQPAIRVVTVTPSPAAVTPVTHVTGKPAPAPGGAGEGQVGYSGDGGVGYHGPHVRVCFGHHLRVCS